MVRADLPTIGRVHQLVAQVSTWALLAAGCATPTKPLQDMQMAPVTPFLGPVALPAGPVPTAPWSLQPCTPGKLGPDVVACVGGVAIPVARVTAIRGAYPADTPVRSIVQALVDEEVLAQAARKTLWGDWLEPVLRREMVARLLYTQFERDYGPAQITDDDLALAWKLKEVRHTYDHPGVYTVTDAQIIVCTGALEACVGSAEAQADADKMAPKAKELAEFLNSNKPRSGAEMAGRVGSDPRFAKVSVVPYTFFFDPTMPFKDQSKYRTPVEPYAMAAMKLQPGDLTPEAVRTPYGWHVFRMEKRVEPDRGKFTDAKVREGLRKDLLDAMRDDKVDLLVEKLAKATGVELNLSVFDPPGSSENANGAAGTGAQP